MPRFHDHEGQTYGRVTVLCRGELVPGKGWTWWVQCSCEQHVVFETLGCNLINDTRSCGCLKRETAAANSRASAAARRRNPIEAAIRRYESATKHRARGRGLDYQLTLDEVRVLVTSTCEYCGIAADLSSPKLNGVDRFDSSLGYLISNSRSCCWPCNVLKSDLSFDDFRELVENIWLRHGSKN